MIKTKVLSTMEELKVYSDPYRLEILQYYKQIGEPATVKQIADKMGEVPAKVHYHVKKLEKYGILELAYTKEINGIVAKFYRIAAEEFNLKCGDIENKKIIESQIERVIHATYLESEKIALNCVKNVDSKEAKEKGLSSYRISSETVYLTKEEADEIRDYIKNMCNKYDKKKTNDKDVNEYHLFNSLVLVK